jgi:hypothetical protein
MYFSFANPGRAACAFMLLICACLPLSSAATEDDDGIWVGFVTTDAFHTEGGDSRWRYWFDAQARYFDIGTGINQYVARPAIGFRPGDNMTAWLGYARLRSRNQSGNTAFENRYWQQIDWTAARFGSGTLTMRARLEQRSVSVSNDTGLVLRLMAKYMRPIGSSGKTSLILGIEPFVDLRDTDWSGDAGLKQNRLIIGVGWQVSDALMLETSYMNQYIWRDSAEDRSNHLGVLNFRLTL